MRIPYYIKYFRLSLKCIKTTYSDDRPAIADCTSSGNINWMPLNSSVTDLSLLVLDLFTALSELLLLLWALELLRLPLFWVIIFGLSKLPLLWSFSHGSVSWSRPLKSKSPSCSSNYNWLMPPLKRTPPLNVFSTSPVLYNLISHILQKVFSFSYFKELKYFKDLQLRTIILGAIIYHSFSYLLQSFSSMCLR